MSQQHIPVHKFVVRLPDWELPKLQLDLRLSPSGSLQGLGRQECPRCRRSRWLFCYDCATPLPAAPPPRLALPFDFLILTHVQERIGKNTGVQAAIIAPDHVRVASFEAAATTAGLGAPTDVLLFPSATAIDLQDLDPSTVRRVIILDTPWRKANELARTAPQFAVMRHVRLSQTRTAFWRHHTKGATDDGVCTVEAIYHLLSGLAQLGKFSGTSSAAAEATANTSGGGGDEGSNPLPPAQPPRSAAAPAAAVPPPAATSSSSSPSPPSAAAPEFDDPHYFDDLLWYFAHQHRIVEERSAQRLQQQQALATVKRGASALPEEVGGGGGGGGGRGGSAADDPQQQASPRPVAQAAASDDNATGVVSAGQQIADRAPSRSDSAAGPAPSVASPQGGEAAGDDKAVEHRPPKSEANKRARI